MANRIKMAEKDTILALRRLGWSFRKIERELGIHRTTASKYVKLAEKDSNPLTKEAARAKPTRVTTGSEHSENSKPTKVTAGSLTNYSFCEPFRNLIIKKLEIGLSAQRIYQDIVADHGFEASYESVKRFVRKLGKSTPLPFRRIETEPGEQNQIDFGTGAPIISSNGKRKRTHVFRVVLSHSRKGYSEAVLHQNTESFIRAIENAFWHFGGVTGTSVIDNLRAAVTKADWYDPELNPKIKSFAEHYGTVILPTKPYTPRHKGKIERGIDYVQENALKGRTFKSLAEENQFLLEWETRVADTRIHGTTKKQVRRVFEDIEKPALRPLPIDRFAFYHEGERSVHRDGHVEVDKSYYSVPPEHVGSKVWVRWDSRLVRVFSKKRFEQITIHPKQEPGRFSTQNIHIASEKISNVEKGAQWQLEQASRIGPNAFKWAAAVLENRGIQGIRVLVGFRSLVGKYGAAELDKACELAHSHGAYRLKHIRALVGKNSKQETFEFIEKHEIIRDLSEYGKIIKVTFDENGSASLSEGKKKWIPGIY